MFEKLFGAKKRDATGHPLSSVAGLTNLLAELPVGDEQARLLAVGDWLEELPEHTDELGFAGVLEVTLALDAASHAARENLMATYFLRGSPGYASTAVLERLATHLELIEAVYLPLFTADDKALRAQPGSPLILAAGRFLRNWGRQRRIGRFRHRPAGSASWRNAHTVLRFLASSGDHRAKLVLFPGEPKSSALREYLLTVFEETVPWGNLLPVQAETAARLIALQGELIWHRNTDETMTHSVDFSLDEGPRRLPPEGVAASSAVRFISTIGLHAAANLLREQVQAGKPLPEPLLQLQLEPTQLAACLQTVTSYWSLQPPSRQSARAGLFQPALGAFGFSLARQLVEVSQNVAKGLGNGPTRLDEAPGRTFQSEFNRAFAAYGYGTVARAERAAEISPAQQVALQDALVRLNNLERAITELVVEQWTELDGSDTGMGVIVPALLPRHAAGALIAWRETHSVQWRLGIVRRVGRDSMGKPTAGIELIAGKPMPAVLHLLNKTVAAEWVLAIVPDAESKHVLVPSGTFVADMPIELISDLGQRQARMQHLVERAGDWDRIEINQVKP